MDAESKVQKALHDIDLDNSFDVQLGNAHFQSKVLEVLHIIKIQLRDSW